MFKGKEIECKEFNEPGGAVVFPSFTNQTLISYHRVKDRLWPFGWPDLSLGKLIYNFTPAPLRKIASASKGHLGFAGLSNSLNCFNLNFSNPTIAIIAALSPHKLIGGNIASNSSSLQRLVRTSLILLFAATPPATTNLFLFVVLFF